MSKKRLSPDIIANELRGNSAFFPAPHARQAVQPKGEPQDQPQPLAADSTEGEVQLAPASIPATPEPAVQKASKHASTLAALNADRSAVGADSREDVDALLIEAIRRSVKQVGKEVSFVRLLPEEKRQLADIAYTYKSQGIKTSENEIARIGIDLLLEDYQANGKASILARVIAALNA